MITYEKSNRAVFVAVALALGLAVGAGVWYLQGDTGAEEAVQAGASDAGKAMGAWIKPDVPLDDMKKSLHPTISDDGRPVDVDPADWDALNGALSQAGIDKKEGQRILSFLRFQHSFEAWQNLDEVSQGDRRRRVGEALIAEVPDRLKSGEFTAIEANLMGAVLIAGIETDEQVRAKRMEDWQAQLNQLSPMPTDEKTLQAQFKQTETARRLASAYDDWQKTDPGDVNRAPGKLAQSFADVRRSINAGE
jgi:hypothetical protein